MNQARFNINGGPIIAEVRSGFAQPGSYGLLLWEADANVVVMERRGNFINSADDAYKLPTPNEHNDHRVLQCLVTLAITPPIKDYRAELIVSQDGNVLGGDSDAGSNASGVINTTLFVQLIAVGAE
jgi:hypothetical protein